MIGQRLNNFEIVRLVGEGGMGAVYEAVHPVIHRKVAVKVLRRELAVDGVLVRRFINEARATNEIRHPNIIEIIDVGTFPDGVPYLMMEMLEGESLARRIERLRWLPLDVALEFALQAVSALLAAHSHGIVHRDLKPDNIFLVSDQRFAGRELVKILDFGIAKLKGDLSTNPVDTNLGSVIGTPAYMSPEQCRGIPDAVDHRTDIYSLGIILYEMLCGEPPFVAPGPGDLMMMQMAATPRPPSALRPDIPPSVEQVILKMLAKRREDRFDSMEQVAAALWHDPEFLSAPSSPSTTIVLSAADRKALDIMNVVTLESARPRMELSSAPPPTSLDHTTDFGPGSLVPPTRRSRRSSLIAGAATAVVLVAVLAWMRFGAKDAARQPAVVPHAAANSEPPLRFEVPIPSPAPPTVVELPPSTERKPAHVEPSAPRRTPSPPSRRSTAPGAGKAVAGPASPPENAPARATAAVPSSDSPPTAEPGFLSFDSMPWSEVYLGDRHLGTTPLIRIALPPGRHVLTLKNPEVGASTSYVVDIAPGKSVSRFVGWEKE